MIETETAFVLIHLTCIFAAVIIPRLDCYRLHYHSIAWIRVLLCLEYIFIGYNFVRFHTAERLVIMLYKKRGY